MTRRTLLALPLAQPLAATVPPPLSPLEESKLAILGLTFEDRAELFRWWFGATARPPLSLDELKDGIIAQSFEDRAKLFRWWLRWWLGRTARPPLSLEELKTVFLALPLNDRVTFALWADNAHRVLSGKDETRQSIRPSLWSFEEDWNAPGMEAYDEWQWTGDL